MAVHLHGSLAIVTYYCQSLILNEKLELTKVLNGKCHVKEINSYCLKHIFQLVGRWPNSMLGYTGETYLISMFIAYLKFSATIFESIFPFRIL